MEKAQTVLNHFVAVAKDNRRYNVRLVHEEDLPTIEAFGRDEHFDIGLENLKLYYETCPQGWNCIEDVETGELVAYECRNLMSNGLNFGYQIIVKPEYQGRGLTLLFQLINPGSRFEPDTGNETVNSIVRFKFEFFGARLVGYYGLLRTSRVAQLQSSSSSDIVVRRVQTDEDLNALVQYDHKIIGVDRRHFMREWCLPKRYMVPTVTFLAQKNGTPEGFVTVRRTTSYWTLAPMYAESEAVARALAKAVIDAVFTRTDYFYVKFPAQNACTMNLVNQLGLLQTETEMQHHVSQAREYCLSLAADKVFAVHEFWPV